MGTWFWLEVFKRLTGVLLLLLGYRFQISSEWAVEYYSTQLCMIQSNYRKLGRRNMDLSPYVKAHFFYKRKRKRKKWKILKFLRLMKSWAHYRNMLNCIEFYNVFTKKFEIHFQWAILPKCITNKKKTLLLLSFLCNTDQQGGYIIVQIAVARWRLVTWGGF